MADADLEAIRAKRMAELQAQQGQQGGPQQQEAQEEAVQRQKEAKNSMLSQILEKQARTRLHSIALVKPERASQIENMLIQMARQGQIVQKINEERLVQMLEQISQSTQKKTTVKFARRRVDSDSDDE
ncbi:programmed cell death protein 5-like [Sycon ciliatum]|uniref:programmed cell death protein 5-like n=1 Tax=Sycon ciliatum TaxID=27933 RepID=UPI0020AD3C30|eukprot:scpid36759/ scgid34097/ Programmed cell death protein 5; TF-1 cell apoptosis-related protein 19